VTAHRQSRCTGTNASCSICRCAMHFEKQLSNTTCFYLFVECLRAFVSKKPVFRNQVVFIFDIDVDEWCWTRHRVRKHQMLTSMLHPQVEFTFVLFSLFEDTICAVVTLGHAMLPLFDHLGVLCNGQVRIVFVSCDGDR
jgi:hypothetical protein